MTPEEQAAADAAAKAAADKIAADTAFQQQQDMIKSQLVAQQAEATRQATIAKAAQDEAARIQLQIQTEQQEETRIRAQMDQQKMFAMLAVAGLVAVIALRR